MKGQAVGSTLIDYNFQQLITNRLERIQNNLPDEPHIVAEKMMKGRFERIKCSYGTPASLAIPTIPLPITDLPADLNFPNINIEGSSMTFSRCAILMLVRWLQSKAILLTSNREELKGLFDAQIDKMLALTDKQFDVMQTKLPRTQIVQCLLQNDLMYADLL